MRLSGISTGWSGWVPVMVVDSHWTSLSFSVFICKIEMLMPLPWNYMR